MITLRLLTALIIFVALAILLQLYRTRNGMLRKLLISYFWVETIVFGVLFNVECQFDFSLLFKEIAFIVIIPKSIVKVFFYFFISKKGSGDNLN